MRNSTWLVSFFIATTLLQGLVGCRELVLLHANGPQSHSSNAIASRTGAVQPALTPSVAEASGSLPAAAVATVAPTVSNLVASAGSKPVTLSDAPRRATRTALVTRPGPASLVAPTGVQCVADRFISRPGPFGP